MKHWRKPSRMDDPRSYKTGPCHPKGNVHLTSGRKPVWYGRLGGVLMLQLPHFEKYPRQERKVIGWGKRTGHLLRIVEIIDLAPYVDDLLAELGSSVHSRAIVLTGRYQKLSSLIHSRQKHPVYQMTRGAVSRWTLSPFLSNWRLVVASWSFSHS